MLNTKALSKLKTKRIYSIEGNIGAGKTTVLKIIGALMTDVIFVEEPINEWQNLGGMNLLEKFYYDPDRWGFSFEFYVMLSKIKALAKVADSDKSIIILERSLFSNKIFMDISAQLGKLNAFESQMLKTTWDFYMNHVYPLLSGMIYLNTSVDVCITRIAKRNREEESSVDASYLKLIHEKLEKITNNLTSTPVLTIDGNFDLNRDEPKIAEEIKGFMKLKSIISY